jgi:hypothetical protein
MDQVMAARNARNPLKLNDNALIRSVCYGRERKRDKEDGGKESGPEGKWSKRE